MRSTGRCHSGMVFTLTFDSAYYKTSSRGLYFVKNLIGFVADDMMKCTLLFVQLEMATN